MLRIWLHDMSLIYDTQKLPFKERTVTGGISQGQRAEALTCRQGQIQSVKSDPMDLPPYSVQKARTFLINPATVSCPLPPLQVSRQLVPLRTSYFAAIRRGPEAAVERGEDDACRFFARGVRPKVRSGGSIFCRRRT